MPSASPIDLNGLILAVITVLGSNLYLVVIALGNVALTNISALIELLLLKIICPIPPSFATNLLCAPLVKLLVPPIVSEAIQSRKQDNVGFS